MFDDMKLGTKIAGGYALVLIITSMVTAFTRRGCAVGEPSQTQGPV